MTLSLRYTLKPTDADTVADICTDTAFFRDDEIQIARELVEETLANPNSGYSFIFAEIDGEVVGYICYGDIPGTVGSFEIYWIATLKRCQGQGVGATLLKAAENALRELNARHIYIHTSGTELYTPTRNFYLKNEYAQVAELTDFYMVGDSELIFRKVLK
ncbi:MAG: GNAT family N-acetyltransferase [Deferribacteraceae bacterium]|nr:GNAT family N-acetyltransferase [Deferribacteraceae bacterium]